ncbi:SPOR domain-containing protein [Sanguibacter sp. 25GB23B1]|uniref:SPOR domain-containing protein n=1 Tax=unclassified Sanguibacter TaxID=2645534 RepID=UPI0032AFE2E1
MKTEFYFNTKTRQVEEGKPSSWTNRMGPYPTREAAARALEKAERRTEAWDEEDRQDRAPGDPE